MIEPYLKCYYISIHTAFDKKSKYAVSYQTYTIFEYIREDFNIYTMFEFVISII